MLVLRDIYVPSVIKTGDRGETYLFDRDAARDIEHESLAQTDNIGIRFAVYGKVLDFALDLVSFLRTKIYSRIIFHRRSLRFRNIPNEHV